MKRIAIFCDGTWNSPDKVKNGVSIATNVVKLAKAVKVGVVDGVIQRIFYDAGVGSSGSALEKMAGGFGGYGLSDNVKDAYRYLAHNYQVGDELYLFGFSRGAYTARSLGNLIRKCGILHPSTLDKLDDAYDLYKNSSKDASPTENEATLFRRTFAQADIFPIKMIGVWDTVGSVGNPLWANGIISRKNSFHETNLSSTVENAFQALAIDEKRKTFEPNLWFIPKGETRPNQTLQQVWFAGVHSDVGGGYAESGLSDIALDWMLEKANACGLACSTIATQPNAMAERHESREKWYKLMPKFFRPIDQFDPEIGLTHESVHESAIQKYQADRANMPKNLAEFLAP